MSDGSAFDSNNLSVAVIVGGFAFDVPALYQLFQDIPGIDAYVQELFNFVADRGNHRKEYDVVLFFHLYFEAPPPGGGVADDWRGPVLWHENTVEAIQEVTTTGQGIVVLHHAISTFRQWQFWSELVGIPHDDREWQVEDWKDKFGETMHIEITKPDHPIVRGLSEWDVENEAWLAFSCSPSPDCDVLMETDHPDMAMKAMAWTHEFGKSRVFCLQPGHGPAAWRLPTFQTLLSRGIRWTARRLQGSTISWGCRSSVLLYP